MEVNLGSRRELERRAVKGLGQKGFSLESSLESRLEPVNDGVDLQAVVGIQ